MTERAKRRAKRRKERTLRDIHDDAQPKPRNDIRYGYSPITITGSAALVRQDIARRFNAPLWGDPNAPTKEIRGLTALIAEPDPLDEILADAGIKDRPVTGLARFTHAGKLDDLAARDEPVHTWTDCAGCGRPIRSDDSYSGSGWIDHLRNSRCDRSLLGDADQHPDARHTPSASDDSAAKGDMSAIGPAIVHDDHQAPRTPDAFSDWYRSIYRYGAMAAGNRKPKFTDITGT